MSENLEREKWESGGNRISAIEEKGFEILH